MWKERLRILGSKTGTVLLIGLLALIGASVVASPAFAAPEKRAANRSDASPSGALPGPLTHV